MKEQLISFETAKLAKEKGFKDCIHYNGMGDYFTNTTQSLLQTWLRNVHNIYVTCIPHNPHKHISDNMNDEYEFYPTILKTTMPKVSFNYNNITWKTYEEALEKGLQKALELI